MNGLTVQKVLHRVNIIDSVFLGAVFEVSHYDVTKRKDKLLR